MLHSLEKTLLLSLCAFGCSDPATTESAFGTVVEALVPEIDARRSLAVTDQVIVSQFSLQAVLDRLVTPPQTSLSLFQDWMQSYAACSEVVNGVVVPNSFNGFPFTCRPADAADQQPFDTSEATDYFAVGLFNRFDVAKASGEDCGEYRMVFARRSGLLNAGRSRKFLIFEAVLPNPTPAQGLAGCLPVANFWADLSGVASTDERALRLKQFFFDGIPGFAPAIHRDHYGALGGQIRVNSFLQFPDWSLREFKLQTVCDPTCRQRIAPAPTATNPHFSLVRTQGGSDTHPLAEQFQETALLESLSAPGEDLLDGQPITMAFRNGNLFNAGESLMPEPIGGPPQPTLSIFDQMTSPVEQAMQEQLIAVSANITSADARARLNALTCQGCHRTANDTEVHMIGQRFWPASFGFTHTSELTEAGPDGPRFNLSAALTDNFLPQRKAHLMAYLSQLSSVAASVHVYSRWDSGYCASITVSNSAASSVGPWQVDIDSGSGTLENYWSSVRTGDRPSYTFAPLFWNASIPASGSREFGFCASGTNAPDPRIMSVSVP
jgi:hypothetical protein